MGDLLIFRCKKCLHEFDILFGRGFDYNGLYQKTVKEVLDGNYGDEWKHLVSSQEYTLIGLDMELYECSCGAWKNEKNLSLFGPHSSASHSSDEIKSTPTPCDDGEELYDYKKNFFVKRYVHKCGKVMHPVSFESLESSRKSLSCPRCGCECENTDHLFLD